MLEGPSYLDDVRRLLDEREKLPFSPAPVLLWNWYQSRQDRPDEVLLEELCQVMLEGRVQKKDLAIGRSLCCAECTCSFVSEATEPPLCLYPDDGSVCPWQVCEECDELVHRRCAWTHERGHAMRDLWRGLRLRQKQQELHRS